MLPDVEVGDLSGTQMNREGLSNEIAARTGGKIQLVMRTDLPLFDGILTGYTSTAEVRAIRTEAKNFAMSLGITKAVAMEWELVVAEAATNALVHGGNSCRYGMSQTGRRIQFVAIDQGEGIPEEHIIPALCTPGYSTKESAGLGFHLMAEVCSRVIVATDQLGTIVQLELDL